MHGRSLLTSVLIGGGMLALLLASGTRADAAIITQGCADTNASCTMTELLTTPSHAGAFFSVNDNLFSNFQVLAGPSSSSLVVKPECIGCGSFGGDRLNVGFGLGFDDAFILTAKGTTLSFVLEYDFTPSQTTFSSTTALIGVGTATGHGDFVRISLTSSGFPGPDLIHTCVDVSSCSNRVQGASATFDPTSTKFTVIDDISMFVDDDTGGTPFVQIKDFEQTFRAVPEPDSIAMLASGLLTIVGMTIWRRRRDASSI